jgi:hypothetical protein
MESSFRAGGGNSGGRGDIYCGWGEEEDVEVDTYKGIPILATMKHRYKNGHQTQHEHWYVDTNNNLRKWHNMSMSDTDTNPSGHV